MTIPDADGRGRTNGPRMVPPLPGGEPHLYALLAVEVKPGYILYFHLVLDQLPGACTIDIDQDSEPVVSAEYLAPLSYVHTAPAHIQATVSGTVVSRDRDYRPPTRTPSTTGMPELGAAPPALPAASEEPR